MLDRQPAWEKLKALHAGMQDSRLVDLFVHEPDRFKRYSLKIDGLLLDYSKNFLNTDVKAELLALAEQMQVEQWRARMVAGETINHTEKRAVMHMALRAKPDEHYSVAGVELAHTMANARQRMAEIVEKMRAGEWLGFADQAITDVLCLGIGGSELGPSVVIEALEPYCDQRVRVRYLANIDPAYVDGILAQLNPATTAIIAISKSFGTQETRQNLEYLRTWLKNAGAAHLEYRHLIAVTANTERAMTAGFAAENILPIWGWVGGRFSLWSAVGLPIALAIGMERFDELLDGAWTMDQHFLNAPLDENAPVLLALLGVWYINFWNVPSHGVFPYSEGLRSLPRYLQQAEMESNGKRISRDGEELEYTTAPVLWGERGTICQHSCLQLLHQGKRKVTSDFIAVASGPETSAGHHRMMFANCLGQAQALMEGRDEQAVRRELALAGVSQAALEKLLPHKVMTGNRPSNMIVLDELSPRTLGNLIALYEHKIFVQGVLWGINSFDQWGVELGKDIAGRIGNELAAKTHSNDHDGSTRGLMDYYQSRN